MSEHLVVDQLGRQADDHSVQRMLSPRSIAVVGASSRTGTGHSVLENLWSLGFPGPIYPVNRREVLVNGRAAFKSLHDLPEVPDLVVIAVNNAASVSVVADAAQLGVRSAVLLASGFGESGSEGRRLAEEVLASRGEMSLVGPNCLGFVDLTNGVAAYSGQMPEPASAGEVALVSNSGAVACFLTGAAAERKLAFSHIITTGNQLDLGVAQFVSYLAVHPTVRVIACYLEGFTDGRGLLEAFSKAHAGGKTVAVLKGGRSAIGGEAARTHTGVLAGSLAVQMDLFSQRDVLVAADPEELLSMMELGARLVRPATTARVGVVTISGGERLLMADAAEESGVELATLSDATLETIRSLLPAYATASNPLDTTGPGVFAGSPEVHGAAVLAVAGDPDVDVLVACQDAKNGWVDKDRTSDAFVDAIRCAITAGAAAGKPVVIVSPTTGTVDARGRDLLLAHGAPCLMGLSPSMRALAKFLRGATTSRGEEQPTLIAEPAEGSRLDSASVISRLAARGLDHWPTRFARSRAEAVTAAEEAGFPVVLKLEARLAHRRAVGGVRVGLENPDQVAAAWDSLAGTAIARAVSPDEMSVQRMIFGDRELFVGALKDAQFGPLVLFGAGGAGVETNQTFVVGLAPFTQKEGLALVKRLPLENAGGGSELKHLSTEVARVLASISELICDDDVLAIDINPLVIVADAVAIIDAKMVVGGSGA